ncbi:MAG: nucleotidyltransferase family protein [Phycisphaerales bacterium]
MPSPDRVAPAQVVGVLLAAGRSRRMGAPKLLLPWPPGGTTTVVAAAFDSIAPFCDRVIVVAGDDPTALRRALDRRPHAIVAGAPGQEMLASARRGLAAAIAGDPPPQLVILHPADQPSVAPATIGKLLALATERTARAQGARGTPTSPGSPGSPGIATPLAVLPQRGARGGHPVVIDARAIPRILAWSGDDGLAGFWRANAAEVVRAEVDDPGVLADLDTPDDYARASDR